MSNEEGRPSANANPAAERLRSIFREHGWVIQMDDDPGQPLDPFPVLADAALAHERKATVERIRAAAQEKWPARDAQWVWVEGLRQILDAEAAE